MLLDDVRNATHQFVAETEYTVQKKLKPPWHLLRDVNESCAHVQSIFDSYTASMQKLLSFGNANEKELEKKVKSSINKVWLRICNEKYVK